VRAELAVAPEPAQRSSHPSSAPLRRPGEPGRSAATRADPASARFHQRPVPRSRALAIRARSSPPNDLRAGGTVNGGRRVSQASARRGGLSGRGAWGIVAERDIRFRKGFGGWGRGVGGTPSAGLGRTRIGAWLGDERRPRERGRRAGGGRLRASEASECVAPGLGSEPVQPN